MNQFKEPLYSQSYIDTGNGHPVVLLHGLFGNIAMWRTAINALRNDYRVIVPRLPLYEIPIHRAKVDSLAEILYDFLNWHNVKNVTLVGTDTGAETALYFAFQYPELVKRIVVSGSSGVFGNLPPIDNGTDRDYSSVRSLVNDAFFKKDLARTTLVDKVYSTINTLSKNLHISAFVKASRKNEISKFLHKIERPVLIIWGLQDKITPPETALHLHDLLRYGTVKFIDECGHLPMIEKGDIYAQRIREFLENDKPEA